MRPHRNLEAWGKAVDFVVLVYKLTESFPKEEKFGLAFSNQEGRRLDTGEHS